MLYRKLFMSGNQTVNCEAQLAGDGLYSGEMMVRKALA
jgi:hypothetical protein